MPNSDPSIVRISGNLHNDTAARGEDGPSRIGEEVEPDVVLHWTVREGTVGAGNRLLWPPSIDAEQTSWKTTPQRELERQNKTWMMAWY